MVLSRTSELEGVNKVLTMLGEAPISSLQNASGIAKQAQDALTNASRSLQTEGWSFNTDYETKLVRNSAKEIQVGTNVTRVVVDPYEYPDFDIVQRGSKLYDRRNKTYLFDEDLIADVTYLFEWSDLPEHARQYIQIRAGRQLQDHIIGAADLTKINITAEQEARSLFVEEETTKSEHNMLRGNPNHTGVFQTYQPSRAVIR